MEFTWPFMLTLLLTIPVLVAIYLWAQHRRQRYALRYANLSVIKEAMARGPGLRRHVPPLLFLGAFTVMIVAMARPVAIVTLPSQQGTVILTVDVSGSMNADDMKPSRIEAAKAAARSFVERQPDGVQIGVVSFSDSASILQAPTTERDKVLSAIDRLDADGGTAIGSAIKTSLDTLLGKPASNAGDPNAIAPIIANANSTPVTAAVPTGSYDSGIIVLLTDGENTWGPPPMDAAQLAASQGVRIYTVGVGSEDGSILHINGQNIRAGLDVKTLKGIAELTGAKYYNATTETDLRSIYENLSARLVLKTERTELTAGFTSLAAMLSLAAGIISLFWFNRVPY